MPDAGEFERDQRDGDIGWGEAFAALPQETPDAGGWQRVQARLPVATRPRTRWPLWLATAASLLLAIAIPLRMLPQSKPNAPTPQISAAPTTAQSVAAATPPSAAATVIDTQLASTTVANRGKPRHATRIAPSQRPIRTVAKPTDTTYVATTNAATSVDLEPLYAQSAQLETLLAMARDNRVASGTTAALSDGLDAQVASIDASLIQSDLSDAQRAELWGERVDALQQLVGIETTNRLYAARGERYDAALVSID